MRKFSRKGAQAQREVTTEWNDDAKAWNEDAKTRNEDAMESEDAARRSSFFAPLRLCVSPIFAQLNVAHLKVAALVILFVCGLPAVAFADRLLFVDGTTLEVDEAWNDAEGVWYRRGGMTNFVERARVKTIEREGAGTSVAKNRQTAKLSETGGAAGETTGETMKPPAVAATRPLWIYLVGGARFEVDEANESAEGVWYKRGNLSIFLERARIERIERESDELKAETETATAGTVRRERRWTTGRPHLDALIRQNGARHGVDPYLIFCVMEQESHFNAGAVSPVGARGLMQLMPGTAARFGVSRIHDPAQNIAGGTRFLKLLLGKFNGRVDLVLASYNAGEGAVVKYGHRVPPYRETRDYVRRISGRYGRAAHAVSERTQVGGKTTAAGSGN